MEQRNDAAIPDCRFARGQIGQRHMDDPKCNNHREHNHSNGSIEIREHAVQILFRVAFGMSSIWLKSTVVVLNVSSSFFGMVFASSQIAVVNNVLRWSIGELKLRFRINLSQHLYNQYLK